VSGCHGFGIFCQFEIAVALKNRTNLLACTTEIEFGARIAGFSSHWQQNREDPSPEFGDLSKEGDFLARLSL